MRHNGHGPDGRFLPMSLAAKFWKYARPSLLCWPWAGVKNRGGYGLVRHNGKFIGAHRAAWIVVYGTIAEGLWVLHRCDNPSCVNPDHLFLGNAKDNMQDCRRKGRIARQRGSENGLSKLTEAKVEQIRKMLDGGESQVTLAREYGVSQSLISLVGSRKIWTHVA